MKAHTIAAVVVTLVATGHGTAWAQDPEAVRKALDRVTAGDMISLLDTDGRRVAARYLGTTDSAVKLEGTQRIGVNRIARITVKDSTRNGTTIGAVVGGGAGLVGALLVGMICANEGGECAAAELGLIALGAGAGAGIGWLGDTLIQREVYRADGTPRAFSPELRVRLAATKRSRVNPVFGLSWSSTAESGLGVEVNADRSPGDADGDGRGFSIDGRAVYAFGRGRVRPFLSGGLGFGHHYENYHYEIGPSAYFPTGYSYSGQHRIESLAPVFGGGVRFEPVRHVVIRPEMSWSVEPTGDERTRKPFARVGVSIGATW